MLNKSSKAEECNLSTYKLTNYPHTKKLSKREMSKITPLKIAVRMNSLGIKLLRKEFTNMDTENDKTLRIFYKAK